MVERALGALRFSPKTILKLTPVEAHHSREANTVLQTLTKKPSLSNLKWSNIVKSKYACLDEHCPGAKRMPKPADTNWESDSEFRGKAARNYPLRLTDDQATGQADELRALSFQGRNSQDCPLQWFFSVMRTEN